VVAQVGLTSGSDLQKLGAGDAILVVASDLHEEAPVWWLRVKQAADRGAQVVVVNPYATRLDKAAAQVMIVRPGDLLATVNQLVNMAKVETADSDNEIVAAAQMLGGAANLVIFYGSAGLTYAETDALARMLGNLLTIQNGSSHAGQVNNGLVPVWSRSNTQGAWDVGLHPGLLPGYKAAKDAGLDAAAIAAGAADGSVNGLLVAGADPVGDGLLSGRGQLDFLVVQEMFMTETAVLADVVFPAQSWAEREGTFTSGERRVQRYYPAIPAAGQSRPDWQILAQLGERLGAGKVPAAASLAFKEVTRAVKQYKGIDYRTLAQVEKQWPDVGGDDLYYGGNAVENLSGLGQQWQAAAEKGDVARFDVPAVVETAVDALQIIYKPALYTPGTLLDHTEMLDGRKAQPTLSLHADDAAALAVADGDVVAVMVDGTAVPAKAHVNGSAPAGLGLLSGVKRWSETAVVKIKKSED
jgi:NADH-quinone oxidoreductase subunit G